MSGDTTTCPLAACMPMPGSTITWFALVVDQSSRDVSPGMIVSGLAVNASSRAGPPMTSTVTWLVRSPAGLFTVSVYVVAANGLTSAVPLAGCRPTVGSISTPLAPLVSQVSVTGWPDCTEVGEASNLRIRTGIGSTPVSSGQPVTAMVRTIPRAHGCIPRIAHQSTGPVPGCRIRQSDDLHPARRSGGVSSPDRWTPRGCLR